MNEKEHVTLQKERAMAESTWTFGILPCELTDLSHRSLEEVD